MTSPERRAPKVVHFTRREGRKGTLSGTQTLPFHSKGGSDRGGGSPSSNTSTTVHFAPWEGHMGGGSPRPGHRHTSMWWPQPAAHTCMVVACACAHSYRHCLRTLTLRSRPAAHSRRRPRQQRPLARSEWQSAARRRSRRLCMCPSPPTLSALSHSSITPCSAFARAIAAATAARIESAIGGASALAPAVPLASLCNDAAEHVHHGDEPPAALGQPAACCAATGSPHRKLVCGRDG